MTQQIGNYRMTDRFRVYEITIRNFFKKGNGCFLEINGQKNNVFFGDDLNDYSRGRTLLVCGKFENVWNGNHVFTVDSVMHYVQEPWFGPKNVVISYFSNYGIEGFSEKDCEAIALFCQNSGVEHHPIKRMIQNYKVVHKMAFLTEEQRKTLVYYFGKYTEASFLEDTFPALKGHKCGDRSLAEGLFNKYGMECAEIIQNDPWEMYHDGLFRTYSFALGEEIALGLSMALDHPMRLRALVGEAMRLIFASPMKSGDTAISISDNQMWACLLGVAQNLSIELSPDRKVSYDDLVKTIMSLDHPNYGFVTLDGVRYMIPKKVYHAECITSSFLRGGRGSKLLTTFSKKEIEDGISEFEEAESKRIGDIFAFESKQKEAIHMALTNPVSIITGGPGTGKTKITQAILALAYKQKNVDCLVTSFTGKAMKRAVEVLKESPIFVRFSYATLLSYYYQKPGENSIKTLAGTIRKRLVIIDEMSMVSQLDLGRFLSILEECQVVFIGDVNQLPSIARGSVLADMLADDKIPHVKLKTNLRLGVLDKESRKKILWNYQCILQNDHNFFYLPNQFAWEEDYQKRSSEMFVVDEYLSFLHGTNGREAVPIEDLILLAPTKRLGVPLSSTTLNLLLQEKINPYGKKTNIKYGFGKVRKGTFLRVGDRVIITQNFRDKNVYNGDVGKIIKSKRNRVTICLDGGMECELEKEELDFIQLAYALTIHKSQGSEYKVVLLALDPMLSTWKSANLFLTNNLLYTGVTRAKQTLLLYGSKEVMKKAVSQSPLPRFTLLPKLLEKVNSQGFLPDGLSFYSLFEKGGLS